MQFMEETGAERVPSGTPTKANRAFMNQRWVFFRRKASEGPFQIYTDADSKIKHYQRIYKVYLSLAFMELIIGSLNLMLIMLNTSSNIYKINLVVGVSVIILGLFFIWLSLPIRRKICAAAAGEADSGVRNCFTISQTNGNSRINTPAG